MSRQSLLVSVLLAATAVARAAEPSVRLPVIAHNYTVRLTLFSLQVSGAYGAEAAPAGTRFYVFGAALENVVDRALAADRDLPVGVKNDNLSDDLKLVLDDSVVVPVFSKPVNTAGLDPNDPDVVAHSGGSTDAAYLRKVVGLKDTSGKRSLAYYALDQPGAKVAGDLIFAVPLAEWHRMELRYHDATGGDCSALLAGSASPGDRSGAVEDPPGSMSNEVFALAARVVDPPPSGLPPAPYGRKYVAVDFQGRSLLKVQDQYPPYDPTHPNGTDFWRPDPAGWGDFEDSVQLAANGRYPGVLQNASEFSEGVSFEPGLWTHRRLLFLVPAAARGLDLTCFFNDYTIPGHDGNVTPKPAHFHLAGPIAPPAAEPAPEKRFADGPVADAILGHSTADRFAGLAAEPGEKFLVLDVSVRNNGPEVAEFHAVEQLVWFNQGDEVPPDDLMARGPFAPPPYVRLATGESRTFQAVWRVPAGLAKAEMGLKGNQVAERFTLALSAPAKAPP